MKILLLGKSGQVGWELQRSLAPLGHIVALDRKGDNGLCGDLADIDALRHTVRTVAPNVIVNAAAYTAVDRAEEEQILATTINEWAPSILAEEAKALNALLVHYSTDYVFNGQGNKPWQENDPVEPLNHYGTSKLAGEQVIQATGCRHLIFRTSWVYAARGNNFLATMARLIRERDELKVISDQVGVPTGAELIADVTAHAISRVLKSNGQEGLYHLTASGETSWHGYAAFIAQKLQEQNIAILAEPKNIKPIPTADWPTLAQRPLNSRLDINKLESTFGLVLPNWQQGVTRVLHETQQK